MARVTRAAAKQIAEAEPEVLQEQVATRSTGNGAKEEEEELVVEEMEAFKQVAELVLSNLQHVIAPVNGQSKDSETREQSTISDQLSSLIGATTL